ncbi:hypothetical protein IW261DRAFT_1427576 [Armillaria novae-zelandiae]|uniref:Uncharacterized protein n=1 Tax=Armillaria novae-zelandiae TaxID=153914 RepID=A0AA39ND24_9AGAR|nr:hypothetical protein IW261DRAFT_1427576 [Armillaria novae-zelandiae]
MTQFSHEQLVAALSALGISPSTMGAAAAHPVPVTASADQAGSLLLAVYCSNCTFPNVVAASAVLTMGAFPLAASTMSRGPPVHATGSPSAAHLLHVPTRPAPVAPAPVAPSPIAPSPVAPPTYAPGQPQPGASAGPDGPWYIVSKGCSVGVFRGW